VEQKNFRQTELGLPRLSVELGSTIRGLAVVSPCPKYWATEAEDAIPVLLAGESSPRVHLTSQNLKNARLQSEGSSATQ